ncbi:hypothetical protein [Brevundimonas phoenicis]|uniref:hypothetical protein n=1 Tax=unclassified Brevundimonas TaxID=2622653 RepID=UPI0039A337EB
MKRSDDVIALGRRLVDLLDRDGRNDLLQRWMAHHVAELMDAAAAPGASDDDKARCRDAVLALWAHRNDLPEAVRPFRNLAVVVRTLERLDPAWKGNLYLPPEMPPANDPLRAALAIDKSAREAIALCLEDALATLRDEDRAMVEAASALDLSGPEFPFLEIILSAEREPAEKRARRRSLQSQLEAARTLKREADRVSRRIRAELGALGPKPPPSDDERV